MDVVRLRRFWPSSTVTALADLGGRARRTPPPWDPILSFSHTFSPKSAHVGGPGPPMGARRPYGKSWIRHCTVKFIMACLETAPGSAILDSTDDIKEAMHLEYQMVNVHVLPAKSIITKRLHVCLANVQCRGDESLHFG